jgi:ABC-type branched-subunit amino acid transport system substrate-binding protein
VPELRGVLERVLDEPLVAARDVQDVMARGRRVRARRARRGGAAKFLTAVVLATAVLRWAAADQGGDRLRVVDGPEQPMPTTTTVPVPFHDSVKPVVPETGAAVPPPPLPAGPMAVPPVTATDDHRRCAAGENGGSTDVGVTDETVRIRMAATFDGPHRTLVADAVYGARAAVDRINRAGGICGRLLALEVTPRPFSAGIEDVLAVVAGPLHAGVRQGLLDGTVDRLGVPVIGGDGLTSEQYGSPWAWPVGTSAASLARITSHHAYDDLGARTFAVVYDRTHPYGTEAAAALAAHVGGLQGAVLRASQPIDPDDPGYQDEAEAFNRACDGACDSVLLAVAPDVVLRWLKAGAAMARRETATLPLALTKRFPQDCRKTLSDATCRDMAVWTPFRHPTLLLNRDLREYSWDTAGTNADASDALMEGSYVAVRVLTDALEQVGPTVTRERLRAALDSMTYTSGLVDVLRWGPTGPDRRQGNVSARELRLDLDNDPTRPWRDVSNHWHRDPLSP